MGWKEDIEKRISDAQKRQASEWDRADGDFMSYHKRNKTYGGGLTGSATRIAPVVAGGAALAYGLPAATTGAAGLTGKQLLGGAALVGSNMYASKQAGKAADTQADAYDRATQAQVDMFNKGQKATAPWRKSGKKAMSQYERLMGLRGGDNQEQAFEDFRNTPGYQFKQDEMMRMLEGTSAAGGTFGSGQMAKDLMKYGGNLADQNYGSYMDRLQGMSTVGANAATNSASNMMQLGRQQGSNAIGQGQAQAGGIINKANLMTNMMNQGAQAYGMYGSRPPSATQSTSFMMPMNQPNVSYQGA